MFHGGLFGRHLWPELKSHVELLGRDASGQVDTQYISYSILHFLLLIYLFRMDAMPRWRNINHFSNVMSITFNDGSKFQDMSKVYTLDFYLNCFTYMIIVHHLCHT